MTTTTDLLTDKIATALLNARYAESADQLGDVRETIRCLRLLAGTVESATRTAVAQARETGASWADVGELLGVSKQAAQQRYGSP